MELQVEAITHAPQQHESRAGTVPSTLAHTFPLPVSDGADSEHRAETLDNMQNSSSSIYTTAEPPDGIAPAASSLEEEATNADSANSLSPDDTAPSHPSGLEDVAPSPAALGSADHSQQSVAPALLTSSGSPLAPTGKEQTSSLPLSPGQQEPTLAVGQISSNTQLSEEGQKQEQDHAFGQEKEDKAKETDEFVVSNGQAQEGAQLPQQSNMTSAPEVENVHQSGNASDPSPVLPSTAQVQATSSSAAITMDAADLDTSVPPFPSTEQGLISTTEQPLPELSEPNPEPTMTQAELVQPAPAQPEYAQSLPPTSDLAQPMLDAQSGSLPPPTVPQTPVKALSEAPPITEDFFKIDGIDDATSSNILAPVTLTDAAPVSMSADALTDAMSMPDAPDLLDSLEQPQEEPDPMQAFAKLSFPDGDFYVHTYAVELGRDVNAHKHERKLGKLRKKRERNERKEMAERRKRQLEEGQLMGDEARSPRDTGTASLERERDRYPAPAMSVSNVSEVGGIMGVNVYSSSEEAGSRTSRRKRKKNFRSSNSSHSLDPNTLHANPLDLLWHHEAVTPPRGLPEGLPDHAYQCPLIPIHPQTGASFKGISRRHVRIEYNLEQGYWEMFVTGRNTVFHNNERIETGGSTRLYHGSEIIIQTITIIFKLPDNARDGEDEDMQELSDSDSPLSDLDDDIELNSSDDEPLRVKRRSSPPKRKIIKLKFSKRKDKLAQKFPSSLKKDKPEKAEKSSKSGKQSSKTEKVDKNAKAEKTVKKEKVDVAERSRKAEKEKTESQKAESETVEKEVVNLVDPVEVVEIPQPAPPIPAPETPSMPPPSSLPPDVKQTVENDEDAAMIQALKSEPGPSETPPAIPAELPPGSVLVGVAPEDIPAKRKGPGRPPKNGVMSKRDEAIIKRLTKELQKQGKMVPSLNELLAMARAEGGTKKDKEERFGEDGKLILEGSITPGPSVSIDPSIMQSVEGASQGTPQIANQATPDKDSKPKRVVRTPSPQKPESEYTEEELKKPTQTYVVLIHEALSKSTTGIMDLQQIYDAMQKMYPFFKYRAGTSGWQSSVRHNLISSEAFQEAGKIGKGRLWKINPDVSIDKEKKRKAPTPPPQTPPQYPYYGNNQYPYGPPQNGGQQYPPYARPSPYGTPYGPPAAPPGGRPPVAAPPQKPGTYYSPYASNPMGGAHASPYGPPSRPPYAAYPPQTPGQPGQPSRPAPGTYGAPPPVRQQPMGGQPQQSINGQPPPMGQQQQQHKPNGQPQQAQYPQQPNSQFAPRQAVPQQQQGQYQQPTQYQNSQNGQGQALSPYAAPQNQPPPSQPPPPTQQPGGIDISKAISNIMAYQAQYMAGFTQGKESDDARAMFTKAMTRAISGGNQTGGFESQAEENLTKKIGEIYAQSRFDPAPAPAPPAPTQAPPQQSTHPPQPSTQYTSTHHNPSPAPSATPMPHAPAARPPLPMNTTPAPPQGNIPARYLPAQYNPQANAGAASQPRTTQASPPGQVQQPQQQRPGSSSDAHLAQALGGYTSSQPAPSPAMPRQVSVPQNQQQTPSQYRPQGQTQHPTSASPAPMAQSAGLGQPNSPGSLAQAPIQAPQQGPMSTTPSQTSATHAQTGHMQPNPQSTVVNNTSSMPFTGTPNQQPPRPTFTPTPQSTQGNNIPPRPTFAPSPVTGSSVNTASRSTNVFSGRSEAAGGPAAPNTASAMPASTPAAVRSSTGSAPQAQVQASPAPAPASVAVQPSTDSAPQAQVSASPAPTPASAAVQQPTGTAPQAQVQVSSNPENETSVNGSLKRPIELDGDDYSGTNPKKVKLDDGNGGNSSTPAPATTEAPAGDA